MKLVVALCAFLLSSWGGSCQIALTGTVEDQNSQPLEFAFIQLLKDSTGIRQLYTDTSGYFKMDSLQPGRYILKVTYVGVYFDQKVIDLNGDTTLALVPDTTANSIGEVVVSSAKPLVERKVDRTVFNVEYSMASGMGDALDVLKVTPGVKVQNDQVLLTGKSSLSVMVNGQMLPLSEADMASYLKSIAADNIKSIEVITTPPSKYQAQGNSGIINIILKQTTRKLWCDNIRSSFFQTTYPALALGNTFIYNKDKIRFLISADGQVGHEAVIEDAKIYYPDAFWHQVNKRKDQKNYVSGYTGVDYNINDRTSVGAQYIGSFKRPDITNNYNAYIDNTEPGQPAGMTSAGKNTVKNNFNSVNLHWVRKLDSSGKRVSIDLDYFSYWEDKDRNFSNQNVQPDGALTDFFSANSRSSQQIANYSAKVDFDYPTKIAKFTYGTRVSFNRTGNNVSYFNTTTGEPVIDPSQTDRFRYSENTQAVYADAEKEISGKWQAKFGLRLENTQTVGRSLSYNEAHKYNYTKLFPAFYLLHTLDKDNSFSLNYSRRLDRPAFWELNPFKWYINSNSYAVGNPFLQPDFVHNVELSHTFKSKLVSTLFFSVTQNGFSQIPSVDSTTFQQVYSRANYFTLYNYGLSESYTITRWHWWESNNQIALNYYQSSFFNKSVHTPAQSGFVMSFTTNNSFTLFKDRNVAAMFNFWYNSSYKALLYEGGKAYSLDIGLRKLFFQKKLQCAVYVTDLFKSSVPVVTTYTNNIKQSYYIYGSNRSLRIMLRYNIGNDKVSGNIRSTGNQDEASRSGR